MNEYVYKLNLDCFEIICENLSIKLIQNKIKYKFIPLTSYN